MIMENLYLSITGDISISDDGNCTIHEFTGERFMVAKTMTVVNKDRNEFDLKPFIDKYVNTGDKFTFAIAIAHDALTLFNASGVDEFDRYNTITGEYNSENFSVDGYHLYDVIKPLISGSTAKFCRIEMITYKDMPDYN